MGNTRFDLTSTEQARLEALGPTYPKRIKRIAEYLRQHGSGITIGRPYAPTTSVHIAFDDKDWEEILNWMALHGDTKRNHLYGRRTTKKELLLHVAGELLKLGNQVGRVADPSIDVRRATIRLTLRRLRRRLRVVNTMLGGLKNSSAKRRRWFERMRARYRSERKRVVAEILRLKLDLMD